jgi:glycosyltransferase involved in cell wall biosynthesis
MRIVHINGHADLNGVATTLKMLVDAQARRGDDILLLHRPSAWIANQSFAPSVTLVETSQRPRPADVSAALKTVVGWKPHVIHAHGHKANRLAALFRLARGLPVVMTAHSRQPQLTWPMAHQVIAINDFTRNYYTARRLVAANRIHTIPNLVDVSHLGRSAPGDKARVRASAGLRPNSFVIGYVGSVDVRKQQTDLVRILKRLVAQGIDAEALIVGRVAVGKYALPALQVEMADATLASRVHLTGEHPDAMAMMRAMDLLICTSHNEEGPLAPVEAMAQGIPALSTRVGNMAAVLPAEQLFAIGDVEAMAAMAARLARDEPLRQRLADEGYATAHSIFHPETVLPRIVAVYGQAIAAAKRWH